MATGDVYYVKMKFADTDEVKEFVPGFHVRQDGVSFDSAAIAEACRDMWNADAPVALKSFYPANIELQAILIRRVKPLEPVEQVITTSLPVAGTAGGDGGDPQASLLVSFRTPYIGRSYRGRMYLPSPAEGKVESGGVLLDADAQDIADQISVRLSTLSDVGQLTPVVVWSPTLDDAFDVTRYLVDKRIRTQRRRQRKDAIYFEA